MGRTWRESVEVTTLLDTTATNVVGTLRWAINQSGARTGVFRVSGTIALVEPLKITKDSITVAGQTAPGDGICLRNFTFNVSANQVIIRYIRSRFGDQGAGKPVDDAINGYSQISHNKKDIIVDHCSASWSLDKSLSFYGYDSLTIQWCLISESLYNSYDPKGDSRLRRNLGRFQFDVPSQFIRSPLEQKPALLRTNSGRLGHRLLAESRFPEQRDLQLGL